MGRIAKHTFTAATLAVVLCLVAALLLAVRPTPADNAAAPPPNTARQPTPELSAGEMITLQLIGLQLAGDPEAPAESGMGVVWNFAAPANRQATGPFERFDAMVRTPPYAALVGHATHEIVRLEEDPDLGVAQALVAVTHGQDAETVWFVWELSRPAEGERANCWVTDAVYPVDVEAEPSDPGSVV